MLTRSAFPVSLLYRTLEKFDDALPIDHYCFSDVQQSIVKPLYHSVTKMRICCSQVSLY